MDIRTAPADYGEGINDGDAIVDNPSTSQVTQYNTNSQQTVKRHREEEETDENNESKRIRDANTEKNESRESDTSEVDSEDENSNYDTNKETTGSRKSDFDEEKLEDEDSRDGAIQLSESVFIYPNKNMSDHGNVFEGEIRSGVYGVRVCGIKIDRKSEQITREARILNKLSSHTHVISIIQSGIYKNIFEERVYIALDKCHEHNLHQHITHQNEHGQEFNLNEALEYSKQIIVGVTYVHENLIIHKDLKPSNILLSHDKSTIKIADFGLSQEIKSTSSKVYHKNQFGTNGFRPIESFGNNWVSLKSDIFSLGVVLYFILSNGKSPFGEEASLWTFNMQNGMIDLSQILVLNQNTFQHLIKLMLGKERCSRPSIAQVSNHPCWTDEEIKCNFDYGFTEEIDDPDVKISEERSHDYIDVESEMESRRKLLKALHETRYKVSADPRTSIIIFDQNFEHLLRFNLERKSVTHVNGFHNGMKMLLSGHSDSDSDSDSEYVYPSFPVNIDTDFSPIILGEHIYAVQAYSLYRRKHIGVTDTWEKMEPPGLYHGPKPTAVVLFGMIYVIGIGGIHTEYINPHIGGNVLMTSKSVSKYDPLLNRWEYLRDKNLATSCATVVASMQYVYCIGGYTGTDATNRVERFNVVSKVWDDVAPMRQNRGEASAVVCGREFIVAGGKNDRLFYQILSSVEKYDPVANQWTIMQPMMEGCYNFRCHFIEGKVYAVGGWGYDKNLIPRQRTTIEKYNIQNNKWEFFHDIGTDVNIYDSVVLKTKNKN